MNKQVNKYLFHITFCSEEEEKNAFFIDQIHLGGRKGDVKALSTEMRPFYFGWASFSV